MARGFNRMLSLPVRQAIVSGSTRAEIDVMMENIGMPADSVDLILSDEDCEKGKPDPEGYLRALDVLDAPAHEALVFEDSPAGMEAARQGRHLRGVCRGARLTQQRRSCRPALRQTSRRPTPGSGTGS